MYLVFLFVALLAFYSTNSKKVITRVEDLREKRTMQLIRFEYLKKKKRLNAREKKELVYLKSISKTFEQK